MAPATYEIDVEEVQPMSRTYQYRKVMKPMLERKRRARINKCLDELKDLMVGALQHDGESITKLEKADVLELTVAHLSELKKRNALSLPTASQTQEKYNSGFRQCTSEVTKFITSSLGIDIHVSNKLLSHLGSYMNHLETFPSAQPIQSAVQNSQTTTPITVNIPSKMYTPPASPNSIGQVSPPIKNHHHQQQHQQQQQQQQSVHQNNQAPVPAPQMNVNTSVPQAYYHNNNIHQNNSNTRIPAQSQQLYSPRQLAPPTPVNQTNNITNVNTYKISSNNQQQQQQYQQQQQQHHQHHQASAYHPHHHNSAPQPSSAPPSPPLSVGSPSPPACHSNSSRYSPPLPPPTQIKVQNESSKVTQKSTLVSPVRQIYVNNTLVKVNISQITDSKPVWRPW